MDAMCVCASDKFKDIHGYDFPIGAYKLGLQVNVEVEGRLSLLKKVVQSLKEEPKSCQN